MLEADPDFAMGNIFTLGIEAMGRSIKECWRLTHMGNIFTLGIEAMGRFIIECWRLTHMGNIFTLGIKAMGRFIYECWRLILTSPWEHLHPGDRGHG